MVAISDLDLFNVHAGVRKRLGWAPPPAVDNPTPAHHPRRPDPPRGVTRRKGSPGVHGWPSGATDRTTRPCRGPQLDPRAGRCCCSQLRRTRIAAQQHQASSPRAATGQSGAPGTSLGPWTPLEWPSGAGKGRAPLIVVLASVSVCLIKFPPNGRLVGFWPVEISFVQGPFSYAYRPLLLI